MIGGVLLRMKNVRCLLLPLAVSVALGLSACKSDMQWEQQYAQERVTQANAAVPVNYKTDIMAFMRTYLNDPSGIRGAYVSEPTRREIQGTDRFVSCVRYTAKKSGGQYASSKDSLVLYRNGRLDHLIDNGREACKDAAYQPFPELEHLSR